MSPSPAPESGPPPQTESPAIAIATRRLCPYLATEDGGWRSAHATKDHRCAALLPPAPLTAEKQRRLCLTDSHRGCATFLAARRATPTDDHPTRAGDGEGDPVLGSPADQDGATVTRWSLVRTAPVVLDRERMPIRLGSIARGRRAPQLMLGVLMVLAFGALAATRLPGPGSPATAESSPLPSRPAVIPSATPVPTRSASPSPSPTASPLVSPTPAPTVRPTVRPTPTPTPPPASRTYTVKAGDTLYALAVRFGTTVNAIQRLNGLGDSTNLRIGQVLKIP